MTSDARRLDVVHVIATLTAGGAERQLEMLAARSRHRTSVVALYDSAGLAEGMRRDGLTVVELGADGRRGRLTTLVALVRLLRRLRPDVVHVHLLSGQLLGVPAARLARVPLVLSTEHSLMATSIEGRPQTWWLRLVYRALERMTSHTIAVSSVTAAHLRRWGVSPARISIADLGVDLDAVRHDPAARERVRRELGVAPETAVIGAVGRLAPVKRMDVVLRASAPLLRRGSVLAVAGAGPLGPELRRLAQDLGVAEQVRWLGSRDPVGPVLSALDVMVSASTDESFGMAVVEAVGAGLPVVYVDCPALAALPEQPAHARQVPATGDTAHDVRLVGRALVAALADAPDPGRPVPASLSAAYGAQGAADRVDAVYDRLLAGRGV